MLISHAGLGLGAFVLPVLPGLGGLGSLDAFAEQIKRVEGYYAPGQNSNYPNGTLAYHNNNPGNIRYTAYYAKNFGAVMGSGNYARFPNYATGWAALKHQITLDANRGLTIRQMMAKYAPSDDGNDPAGYAASIARGLGVSVDARVADVIGGVAATAPQTTQNAPVTSPVETGLLDATVMLGGVEVPVTALALGSLIALATVWAATR